MDRELVRKVERLCWGWSIHYARRTHPQFEDIVADTRLYVLENLLSVAAPVKEAAANVLARQGVIQWLRGRKNDSRVVFAASGLPVPEQIPLPEMEGLELRLRAVEPDFVPELVERLWREWLWQRFWAKVYEDERQLVAAYLHIGSMRATAQAMGISVSRCEERLNRALNRERRQWGVPTTREMRKETQFDPERLSLSPEDEPLRWRYEWRQGADGHVYRASYRRVPGQERSLDRIVALARDGEASRALRYRHANGDPLDCRRENLIGKPSWQWEQERRYRAPTPESRARAAARAREKRRRLNEQASAEVEEESSTL